VVKGKALEGTKVKVAGPSKGANNITPHPAFRGKRYPI